MHSSPAAKHYLQRSWESYQNETSGPAMSLQEKLDCTTSLSTLTHIRMPNGNVVKPDELPLHYGFSLDQWTRMKASLERLPVRPETEYCVLGGIALTLEAFEAGHSRIQLGQE